MSPLKVGALFAGYGGIELALASVLDVDLTWYAEYDKGPASIMAHHHPDVPNLWDVTKVDWSSVEPVDVITGGSPCQDLSHAGKRAGMKAGTRSGLWASMCDAIDIIRPRLVVWENVRGALSAEADSALEPCPGCVGDGDDGPVLRALGRVLGDLSELGYDARWYGLRAADVGGAHGRFRIFLFATPGNADLPRLEGRPAGGRADERAPRSDGVGPRTLTLLPTPAVNDMGAAYTPETWDAWTDRMKAEHGNGNGHGKSLAIEAQRLLPTPSCNNNKESGTCRDFGGDLTHALTCGCNGSRVDTLLPTPRATRGGSSTETTYLLPTPRATDGTKGGPNQAGSSGDLMLPSAVQPARWGDYAAAIARAEQTFAHRPAPDPTEPNAKGGHRLSPRFVEWLMGLPEGHVTDVPGITRNVALKALGNGVVPQQCAAALRAFIEDERKAVAA